MSSETVKLVSECFIKPKIDISGRKQPYYLAPGDLAMLSANYIQKGLLFTKPSAASHQQVFDVKNFLKTLQNSLSLALAHFYPLAGQFVRERDEDQHTSFIFINCEKGPGAKFIHATLSITVSDILSPTDVPPIVQMFFDHHKAVNHDGHTMPLLSVQVTELTDGIFVGCSMNHAVADGTSYWQFWNVWSEIHRQESRNQDVSVLNGPIHDRWFPEGSGTKVNLPFTDPDEFIGRYESPQLRERIFHFSSETTLMLKNKANSEAGNTENDLKISSLQALCAFVWRCIARARRLQGDQRTICNLDANVRRRLDPPLPQEYFGNAIWVVKADVTAEELFQHDLGWTAVLLHQSVTGLTDRAVRSVFEEWVRRPLVIQPGKFFDSNSIVIGSSPRFDVYGNEFGLGKPVAARSGYAHKYPGKITLYPGPEGEGSMDLEICLMPESMAALESDVEFMSVITSSERDSGKNCS